MLEALVEQLDYVGENVAQVIEDALHFAFDFGTLGADFAGSPQAIRRRGFEGGGGR